MKPIQKVIKYVAMAFAIFLMVSILSAIVSVIGGVAWGNGKFDRDVEYSNISNKYEGIVNLDIQNGSSAVNIMYGDVPSVVVEGKNVPDYMTIKAESDGTLVIDADDKGVWVFHLFDWGVQDKRTEINITLPREFKANKAILDSGSGRMEIQSLLADVLDIDGGSGKMVCNDLKANKADINLGSGSSEFTGCTFDSTELSGGSGNITMTDCTLNETDFDVNSGSMDFKGSIAGPVKVEGGSGRIDMELEENEDDYYLEFEAGSGGVWLNGSRVDDYESNHQNSKNKFSVDGNSGRVSISFK